MFPILLEIGSFSIKSYGLMLAIAVIVCMHFLKKDAAKSPGIDKEKIYDLVFWSVLGGILGARIFFILLNVQYFVEYPLEIVMLQRGGLAWQGGFVFGAGVAAWYIRNKKMPFLKQ